MSKVDREREACAKIVMRRAIDIEAAMMQGLIRSKDKQVAELLCNQLVDCCHEIMNRGESKESLAMRKARLKSSTKRRK